MNQVKLLLVLIAVTIFTTTLSAQDTREAQLSVEGYIQIAENDTPDGRFMIDISGFEFETPAEMTEFFQQRCEENFTLRAIPHENKVMLIVRGDKQPDWNVGDWNAHFAEKLAEKPIIQ